MYGGSRNFFLQFENLKMLPYPLTPLFSENSSVFGFLDFFNFWLKQLSRDASIPNNHKRKTFSSSIPFQECHTWGSSGTALKCTNLYLIILANNYLYQTTYRCNKLTGVQAVLNFNDYISKLHKNHNSKPFPFHVPNCTRYENWCWYSIGQQVGTAGH